MGVFYSIYTALFGGGDDDSNQPDDGEPDPGTGLTPREKKAIQSSWALLASKKDIRNNGVEFFVMLFEEYPYQQDVFKMFKGKSRSTLRKDRVMWSHALTVMYSLGSLVDSLDDAEQLVLLVNKIARNHIDRGVTIRYFKDLAEMFPKFLETQAGSAATPFVRQSWSKLLGAMNSIVQQIEKDEYST